MSISHQITKTQNDSSPSWYSGRLWLMRLGYHKLHRPKKKASDWVWIIDHSIQMGTNKCLVILGIRLSELPKERALTYEDVEPLELVPVTHSNGTIVYEQLQSVVAKTGIPREIISDKGADLHAGITLFCQQNAKTSFIYDMKHGLAALLKKELEPNPLWFSFKAKCKLAKQQLYQTPFSYLVPPNQRPKARYMNVNPLIEWGTKINIFLNQGGEQLDDAKKKLSWLADYSTQLDEWKTIMEIIACTEHFIRTKGIYRKAAIDLEQLLNELEIEYHPFKHKVIHFVKEQSIKAKVGERLLGSSEIIESLFGKQKNIQKEQTKSGFTSLLLSLAAITSKTTAEIISEALTSVKTKIISGWIKLYTGESVQSQRTKTLNSLGKSEQKTPQISMAA